MLKDRNHHRYQIQACSLTSENREESFAMKELLSQNKRDKVSWPASRPRDRDSTSIYVIFKLPDHVEEIFVWLCTKGYGRVTDDPFPFSDSRLY